METLPTKSVQWGSDVPIKQTIMRGDGHCFNGCVKAIKISGSTKERVCRSRQRDQE